jgi:two-component system phosphate regulon response regulator OmpR
MSAAPENISLLILDDEAELRALLQRYLGEQGLRVRAIGEPAQLDRLLTRERFDLLILDLMLPGEDGLSICRRLRAAGETIPIIMLTAKGDPVDRIIGLEMGADDYLAKPFTARELLARIQALLRRQRMTLGGTARPADEVMRFGRCELNAATRSLLRDGQPVPLGSTEFALLRALVANAGRPLGRERLLELAHGREHVALDRSIDVQVMRLRKAIEDDPAQPRHIRTVWGVGYVFVADPGAAD